MHVHRTHAFPFLVGDMGDKVGQSRRKLGVSDCAVFCKGISNATWFILWNIPGFCMCQHPATRTFPGMCYKSDQAAVGTLAAGCHPGTITAEAANCV